MISEVLVFVVFFFFFSYIYIKFWFSFKEKKNLHFCNVESIKNIFKDIPNTKPMITVFYDWCSSKSRV